MASSTDRLYRRLLAYTRFFSKGWGPVDTYEKLLDHRHVLFSREGCADILRKHPQRVNLQKVREMKGGVVYEGEFLSPLAAYLPGLLPRASETARFEMTLPQSWREADQKPVYIHLAGTGDHYFWRRRHLTVIPTLKSAGIGAVCLENPLYGSRKPPEQKRSQVRYVSDLFVMGMALILECMVIMHWLEGRGHGPVGLTGFSMGGHNCSLAAALWPKEVAVVPCLSWSTASSSFTEGLLSRAVCWDVLAAQLCECRSGRDERRRNCFRRIRELEREIQTMSSITDLSTHHSTHPAFSESEEPAELTQGLWQTALSHGATQTNLVCGSDNSLSGAERERPGLGQRPPERAPLLTASVPSLLHLTQLSLTHLRQRVARVVLAQRGRPAERERNRWVLPRQELLETMRMVLDCWTHHQNFPLPLAPSLAHFVAAEDDAYIPRQHITDVRSLWDGGCGLLSCDQDADVMWSVHTGCEVEFVGGGHISTTLMQGTAHKVLRQAMRKVCQHQIA